jgi:hypothetical protein
MLDEAVDIIRLLWSGEEINFWGEFYTVENARLFTLPDELPPIYVAASGSNAAERAGQIGDGFITTSPDAELGEDIRSEWRRKTEVWQSDGMLGGKRAGSAGYRLQDLAGNDDPRPAARRFAHPRSFESVLSLIKKEDLKINCRLAQIQNGIERHSGIYRCRLRPCLYSSNRAGSGRLHAFCTAGNPSKVPVSQLGFRR